MTEGAPAAGEASSGTRRKLAVVGMLAAGLAVPALGLAVAWRSCGRSAVAGSVTVEGSTLGSWRTTILRCRRAAEGVRGVELVARGGETPVARVEVDPLDGPIVTVWSTDGQGPLVVRKQACAALAADVRDRGAGDDAPARFDGNVEGTCPLPGGGTLTIDAWWRDCGE